MNQMKEIIYLLEEIRVELNSLINVKIKLTEPQVIEKSQKLDRVLNRYNELTLKL